MEQLFIFTALLQTVLITFVLGKRATLKDLPALLLFLLMSHYTLVIFLGFWNTHSEMKLTRLHLPIGYSAGPILYYFVRFSFLPIKKIQSKQWLWWFLPAAFELFFAVIYWSLFALNSHFEPTFKVFANGFNKWSFIYFIEFSLATIVFLVRHNALITMNLVYKNQFKWIKILLLFIVLFIVDEGLTDDGQVFFSGLLACGFTSTFLYFLLTNHRVETNQTVENKELLKEALNEQEKAVVISNPEGIVEYVNEAFLGIVGYRHRDVVGRPLCFMRGELTTPESLTFMQEKMDAHLDFEVENINYRKNGEAYVCRSTMIPVFSNNVLTHYIAYKEDVRTILAAAPQEDELQLMEKISTYFDTHEPFKNKQLQVADVADFLGIAARRIGEIIKKCEDKSFSEFVNTYRTKAVIKMMESPDNQHITIEAISQMCGFNSKSVFNVAFKKETGKTPSQYLEEIMA
jgi:PAS domain S-box-containing protein